MKALKTSAFVSITLGILSFLWLVMDYLALTDIWHDEPDTSLEWKIVPYGFLVHATFYVTITITFILLFQFRIRTSNRR